MYKKERLAEQLHSFLAGEIRKFHGDSYSLVTLTEVRPSKDYKSAKIFWTMPAVGPTDGSTDGGNDKFLPAEQRDQMQKALNAKIAFLKRRIAEELQLRFVPSLSFVFDESAQRGSRIDELLKKAGY